VIVRSVYGASLVMLDVNFPLGCEVRLRCGKIVSPRALTFDFQIMLRRSYAKSACTPVATACVHVLIGGTTSQWWTYACYGAF
jgi:hypothetical protein